MARNPILRTLFYGLLACLAPALVQASEHHGMVRFAGLPVPGATVTATQGEKKVAAVTDPQGIYTFADLADGVWNLQVEMLCFTTLKMEVAVAPNAPSPEWELKLLPFDEIKASAPPPPAAPLAGTTPGATAQTTATQAASPAPSLTDKTPTDKTPAAKKGSKAATATAAAAANARPGFQRADLNASGESAAAEPAAGGVDEAAGGASDALLVNGSVSNGVERRAIGNFRKGPGSGYRGDLSTILDNSALNARNFSLTGQDTPRSPYNHLRFGATFGGPLSIPHLFRTNNGNFFVAYQGTRNRNASTQTALMPTAAERTGDLSQTLNPLGNPVQLTDPSSGAPFPGNAIPATRISPQAKALLNFYPSPNFNPSAES